MSEVTAERDAPDANRVSGDLDAPLEEQLLDIPVAQGVSVVEPDGVSDDRERESITGQLNPNNLPEPFNHHSDPMACALAVLTFCANVQHVLLPFATLHETTDPGMLSLTFQG
jgi:hypothetical protein